jgi:hypothetical protein
LADAGVAIYADDEYVALGARQLQSLDMAGVQDIEASVGEYDAASVAFLAAKPQNRFVQSECRRMIQGFSQQEQRGMTANGERLVYHAG